MNKNDFKQWLIDNKKLAEKTADSRVSECQRIDNEYDLDSEYQYDKCKDLLELFEYHKSSFNNGEQPYHGIPISGNTYTVTTSLKAALKLYIEFNNEYNTDKSKYSSMYIGNYNDFKHFVNGFCRNKVTTMTRTEKSKCKGICEYCGKKAELQSAHRAGQERLVIIKNVLDTYFKKDDDYYIVDLANFEKYFIKMQQPFKDHFYYLCEDCHSKYENGIITQEQITETIDR